jgi:hypothetical protein
MAFNVQRFSDNLNNYGTLQTNKFEVFIQNPRIALDISGGVIDNNREPEVGVLERRIRTNLSEDEKFSSERGYSIHQHRIDSIRVPSVIIDTYETKRYGVGPGIKTGTNARFDPFSISVIIDQNFDLYKFFHNWINKVFNFSGRQHTAIQEGRSPSFLTSYKNNYRSDVETRVFDNNGNIRNIYFFRSAFPIGLTNPTLSWRDNNSLYKFDVSFAYENWDINNIIPNALQAAQLATARDEIAAARIRELNNITE